MFKIPKHKKVIYGSLRSITLIIAVIKKVGRAFQFEFNSVKYRSSQNFHFMEWIKTYLTNLEQVLIFRRPSLISPKCALTRSPKLRDCLWKSKSFMYTFNLLAWFLLFSWRFLALKNVDVYSFLGGGALRKCMVCTLMEMLIFMDGPLIIYFTIYISTCLDMIWYFAFAYK